MITDEQFQEWLDTPEDSQRCVLVELDWQQITDPISGPNVNVAVAARDATIAASSVYSASYPAEGMTDAARSGAESGGVWGFWRSETDEVPHWAVVEFANETVINRVNVFSVQDNYAAPIDPPPVTGDGDINWGKTGSTFVIQDFDLQLWVGSTWQTIASIRDNTYIKCSIDFYPYKTKKIRILILRTPDNYARCTEIEAFTPARTSGTEYLATMPFVTTADDSPAHTSYLSAVKNIPSLKQSMSDLMIGKTTANIGEISVFAVDEPYVSFPTYNVTALVDAYLFQRDWIGRGARMYIGDASWPKSDFRSLWTGVIATIKSTATNIITFEVRDLQHLLNQPIRTSLMEGGPSMNASAPFVIGKAFNVPAVLIDEVTHKYRIHDTAIGTLGTVYAGGVAVGGVTNNGDGTFTLAAQPTKGRVTVDITSGGTSGSLILSNASDMIKYLVTQRGYLTDSQLDIDSFNALKLLCPAPLGYAAPAADAEIYQAVDEILNTIGGYAAVNREGKYYVKRFELGGNPVMTIDESSIELNGLGIERIIQPVRAIRIGSKKNNAITPGMSVDSFGSPNELVISKAAMGVGAISISLNNDIWSSLLKTGKPPNPTPAISNNGTTADTGTLSSLFANEADAQAEANRRMTIWGFPRFVFSVKCAVRPLRLKLGDPVLLKHSRYGLSGGRVGVVISINERMSYKRVQLGVIL